MNASVTESAPGIGRACTVRLAKDGARAVLPDTGEVDLGPKKGPIGPNGGLVVGTANIAAAENAACFSYSQVAGDGERAHEVGLLIDGVPTGKSSTRGSEF